MIPTVRGFISKLLTTVVLILSLLLQTARVLPLPDDSRFKAILISDVHAVANPIHERDDSLRRSFAALGKYQSDADALVMAGDVTNSGDLFEYIHLNSFINAYCRVPARIPEMGNHDSWHHTDSHDPFDFRRAQANYRTFCAWNGIFTDTVYYEKTVQGYAFISVSVEDCDTGDPYISDEQLRWADGALEKACATGRPVFFICHKPIGSMGARSERLHGILLKHSETGKSPILFISGHYHRLGADTYSVENPRLMHLNLPSFLYTGEGGLGFTAEIAGEKLVLTGMDFRANEALDGYRYEIPLTAADG